MENLCKTPLASMDYTKGMTYGSILAGAAMAYSGYNRMFPMLQFYTGCMAAGAVFDYYCRGDAFALDNRLAQEMVVAAVAGYAVTRIY